MLHFGVISEIDAPGCRARVHFQGDDFVSDFLPVGQSGTLTDKGYKMYDVGEHVAVLMDENAEAGVILCAIFSEGEQPDAPATGAGERSVVARKSSRPVVTAQLSRQDETAGIKANKGLSAETDAGDIELTSGQKVKITAAGKLRIDAGGVNLHTLLGDIGSFLQLHKHTVAGAATTVLLPDDLVKATSIITRINLMLE